MNNREELPSKMRDKRSYEFLMGLINNNSRFEVTRVESEFSTPKTTVASENAAAASELLLELMVRIAAHPDQWNKVHKLLQSIDEDLTSSRNVFETIRKQSDTQKSKERINTTSLGTREVAEENSLPNHGVSRNHHNSTKKLKKEYGINDNRWPTFDKDSGASVKFVHSNETKVGEGKTPKNSGRVPSKPSKSTYPKNFAYHRVTGKPINLNRNPKAYIAVSVIAPKPTHTRANQEDITLEEELHQLKPWTHNQNLQNMASIRSRWVIQNETNKESTS